MKIMIGFRLYLMAIASQGDNGDLHNVFICDNGGDRKVNICTQIVVINNDLFVN